MQNTICNFIYRLNSLLWGDFTVVLILFAGLFLTIRCGFIQFRNPVKIIQATVFSRSDNKKKAKNGISNIQALSTALGASMGTGNIVGVAAAISIGGSGSVLWMILSSFIVMSLAFTENVLGIIYKNKYKNSSSSSGAILYIDKGLNCKSIAVIYALFCLAASFGIGNISQSNSAALSLSEVGIAPVVSGLILCIVTAFSVFKGGRFIASVSEKFIPFISVLYIICAFVCIIISGNNIIDVLTDMFCSAFGIKQAAGGFTGTIINVSLTTGMRRGLFSNEAGMGSSVFAHTSTDCTDPCTMGLWAMVEVFIDTALLCTLTALVILCTGADKSGLEGAAMVIEAFRRCLGNSAAYIVAAANTFFAAASISGWYYYGEKCALYLSRKPCFINSYRFLYSCTVFIGAVFSSSLLWAISDILNAFVMFPNLAAILILSSEAVPYAKEFNHGNRLT